MSDYSGKLHLISPDIPYPPDYGGMIDVYYTIKELALAGTDIYLHCFQYGDRKPANELEQYCKKIWYYPRKTGLSGLSPSLPYMMYSRRDDALLRNLKSIKAPIVFEGIHCCSLLSHRELNPYRKILRNHNVEQQYYKLLAERESNLLKKTYYLLESLLLKKVEGRLQAADALVPISEKDYQFFHSRYPEKEVAYIAGFHPFDAVQALEGKGKYCLYQGNLGHPENIEIALFLIREVFSHLEIPLILAGRNPDARITAACAVRTNITLIANPDSDTMSRLIRDAHIHVLPTFQASGLKLKLLYALYSGRFVLANKTMLYGTGLDDICVLAEGADGFREKITALMQQDFTRADILHREAALAHQYSNKEKIVRLLRIIAGEP